MRSAKLTSVVVGDLRKRLQLVPEKHILAPTLAQVRNFNARRFAFDLEWDRNGITLCGIADNPHTTLVIPFQGEYIPELQRIFSRAEALIGHNIIGADMPWLRKLGWTLPPHTAIQDTMLKQHLVQPDYPHGLDFVSSIFTQRVFWKGKRWEEMDGEGAEEVAVPEEYTTSGQQWRTWESPNAIPRSLGGFGGCHSAQEAFALYNARDTSAEREIDVPLSSLLSRHGLTRVYENVSRPAGIICQRLGEAGVRIDSSRIASIRNHVEEEIGLLETRLPEGLAPYVETVGCNIPAPPNTYRPATRKCKGRKKDGTSHPSVDIEFTQPHSTLPCPACNTPITCGDLHLVKILRGTREERVTPYTSATQIAEYVSTQHLQPILNRKTNASTTGVKARNIWAKSHVEFAIVNQLRKHTTIRNNFAKDSLLNEDRMYFNLKVHGTSEGRLSSSGQRKGVDLNIQNQPAIFRDVYVPDYPEWGFINGDLAQGENWLTAWIAHDWPRWERLQDPTYCEHSSMASAIFNRVVTKESTKATYWAKLHPEWTKELCASTALEYDTLRQIAKKINHGRNYGMGYIKQQEELAALGYDQFTAADVKEFIAIWKKENARTAEWQDEVIGTVEKLGYLRNDFGRIRWFSSRSAATEALAFLPASTLADCVLRMMIAHYPEEFQRELDAEEVDVYSPIIHGWKMSIQVHDSLVLQGPWEGADAQQERSHAIMTQRWKALGGFAFRDDWKRSNDSWGACR
jgi:hypothetical protein